MRGLLVLLLVALLSACGARTELYSNLPEQEANEIFAALLNSGIAAQRITGKDGVTIRVATAEAAQAVDALRARGLPRERFAGMGEIFRKEGLISSPVEERARFLFALSQELSNTISQIDGVLTARVHLVLPERGAGGDENVPSSAAVFIKHSADVNLDAVQPQIRHLVSNSIPSLAGDNVSLVLVAAYFEDTVRDTALTTVLGFPVAMDAASRLAATLVVLILLVCVSLGAAVAFAWLHFAPTLASRKAEVRRDPSARDEAPAPRANEAEA